MKKNNKFVKVFKKNIPYLLYPYYKYLKTPVNFKFCNKDYKYYWHWYNLTFINERAVEIPIFLDIIKKNQEKNILEIGNVMSHYFSFKHDVVDKYEKYPNTINQDVADFKSKIKYDLIISISTLEHVGYDEYPKDPHKILRAIDNLKNCLNDCGELIISLPLGHNLIMDKLIKEKKILFSKIFYLTRMSDNNMWKESSENEVMNKKYDKSFNHANSIIIGIIKNELMV